MKKILSIFLAALLAFSVITCAAFAQDTGADKGIAFLKTALNDRGVKISLGKVPDISGIEISDIDAAVKLGTDSVDICGSGKITLPVLGTKKAKIYVSGNKAVASFSIFKIDISAILEKLGQNPEDALQGITEIAEPVNELLSKFDPAYLDYLECKKTESNGSRYYGIGYQAIADEINEISIANGGEALIESPATLEKILSAVTLIDRNPDMKKILEDNGIPIEEIAELIEADSALMEEIKKGAEISDYILRMDYDGDTLVGISVNIPEAGFVGTDSLGVEIKSIANLSGNDFKEPGGINITGLVKFVIGIFFKAVPLAA